MDISNKAAFGKKVKPEIQNAGYSLNPRGNPHRRSPSVFKAPIIKITCVAAGNRPDT